MDTGQRIKQLRKAKGLTQEELGALIGVRKAAVNKYETGKVINLKHDTIVSLAEALGCTPSYLVDGFSSSEDEFYLVRGYRLLNDEGKSYLSQQLQIALKMFKEE